MGLSEKKIEYSVCNYAKLKNMIVLKFNSTSSSGYPDRLFITEKGFMFFIEFKTKIGRLSAIQKHKITILANRNVKVYVVDDVNDGKKIIDKYLI